MQGINLLKKHGVEWNAMAVINDFNADYPLDFYRFFKEIGCQYIQFAPIVERILSHEDGRHLASLAENKAGTLADFYDHSGTMGQFPLCSFRRMGERRCRQVLCTNIRFDSGELDGRTAWVYAQWQRPAGHAGVMEFNGDVYSCDHFVFPEYKLGNIYSKTLVEMMHSERQHNFGNMKYQSLPTQCKECEFLFACNGECPKNRFSQTAEGEPGLNYLCKGYYQFFKHVAPYMDFMKNELMNQRPPANIMEALKNGDLKIEY